MAHEVDDLAGSVVVVGSANVDQVFGVERIPRPGETVLSTGLSTVRGGKGQNQAVAAARAGATTTFVAAVGRDAFGELTRVGLMEDGIDTSFVRDADAPTGTAIITVEPGGENTIVVEAGANAALQGLTPADREAIARADVLVMQLEIPLGTVAEAASAARDAGTTVILNAAPAHELPDALLRCLDVLVVNEHEATLVREAAGATALTDLVPTVVVTLGAQGAALERRGLDTVRVPAPRVAAVDATGAGDTFCGAFAAVLARGGDPVDALRFAVAAASLSVQRAGAVPSIPVRADIDAVLA